MIDDDKKSDLEKALSFINGAANPGERQLRKAMVYSTLYRDPSPKPLANPIPAAIALAKKTPGLYLMKGNNVLFLRVNSQGEVFQVNPRTMLAEGRLRDDGWNDNENTQNARVYLLEEVR